MRCVLCARLSLVPLCKGCKNSFKPRVSERKLDDFIVYSFFGYDEISELLHTKHKPIGVYVFNFLATISFQIFLKQLNHDRFSIIPIDDKPKGGYSHTAVLSHGINLPHVDVYYASLRATNKVSYSGKSLKFRKSNPRNFKLKIKNIDNIILLDDIITSGTTILEAKKCLQNVNLAPLFALTLADANIK